MCTWGEHITKSPWEEREKTQAVSLLGAGEPRIWVMLTQRSRHHLGMHQDCVCLPQDTWNDTLHHTQGTRVEQALQTPKGMNFDRDHNRKPSLRRRSAVEEKAEEEEEKSRQWRRRGRRRRRKRSRGRRPRDIFHNDQGESQSHILSIWSLCTVAILAQGTHWAVAVTQAFCHSGSIPNGRDFKCEHAGKHYNITMGRERKDTGRQPVGSWGA